MRPISPPLKPAIMEFWQQCSQWEPNIYAQVTFLDEVLEIRSVCDIRFVKTTKQDYASTAARVQWELSEFVFGRIDVFENGPLIEMAMKMDGDAEPACRLGHVFAKCPSWKDSAEFEERFRSAWRSDRLLGRVRHLEWLNRESTPILVDPVVGIGLEQSWPLPDWDLEY